jgi:hypothetical protein
LLGRLGMGVYADRDRFTAQVAAFTDLTLSARPT